MSAARAILAALAGLLLCAAAQAQELNSEFVSQSVPPLMTAGQSYPVSVTLKNTGTWGWGTTSGHFLGSQNPQDNTNWGLNRVPLPQFVGPGQNVTFSFNVTAPATAGTYNFQWRMVNPATYGWFGATTPNVSVQVNVADAAFVSQSVPATMVAGQSASVSITLQNTGGTTWAPGSTALGSQNPQDNSAWGLNRVALPAPVAPGASATFNFSISAPSTPGTYNFQWRMLEGTNGWFGAPSTNVAVSVISGTPDANVFFIHTDHLNTPRMVANSSGTPVWRWDQQEPFGVNVPDENPSALGAFEFSLRFPGQYADKETNLFYNYFRDCYDPSLGRYCESDPIGLHGGLNTYNYAGSTPVSASDPDGLAAQALGVPALVLLGGAIIASASATKPKNLPAQLQSLWDKFCAESNDPCQAIEAEIQRTMQTMRNRRNSMLTDPRGLYTNALSTPNPSVTGTSTTWEGHVKAYEGERGKLINLIALAKRIPCPVPPEAEVEANIPAPMSPRLVK